jgi:SAM-dependent methyltransferase
MASDERWLATMWPRIYGYLPAPPALVVEIGCGPLGGFVPMLRDGGFRALGIDPRAPDGAEFQRIEFERSDLPAGVDAVVACTSLHHVAEPAEVLDKIARSLAPGGLVIVVEWDWESFDEATARWCFERLAPTEPRGWLSRRRSEWTASEQPWDRYLRTWAETAGVACGRQLLAELDQRFDRLVCESGPYFFADLTETTEAEELRAISAGVIRAPRIDYVGRLRSPTVSPQR